MTENLVAELGRDGVLRGLPDLPAGAIRLTGHASTRRFYRCRAGAASSVLIAYAADQEAELDRYIGTAAWCRRAGVRVPSVLARGERALLVEDGGDLLLDRYPAHDRARLRCYRQATEVIVRIQRYGRRVPAPNGHWALDFARLRHELEFAERHAFHGWLGETAASDLRAQGFERIARACADLPRVVCHRDFHARNLLVFNDRLMVLDFQDIMKGPVLYDAASLLWDNYCDVPTSWQTEALSKIWHESRTQLRARDDWPVPALPRGLPAAGRQAFALVALQRSLKALGTFGYQVTVAGNTGYAAYASRTWRNARRALRWLGLEEIEQSLAALDRLTA